MKRYLADFVQESHRRESVLYTPAGLTDRWYRHRQADGDVIISERTLIPIFSDRKDPSCFEAAGALFRKNERTG